MSTGFELPGEEPSEEPRPKFGSVRRGYDPMEVDAFLAQVASRIRSLEARSRQVARVAPEDDDDRLAARFARILAVQEQETESLLTEAHIEASEMVAEAKRGRRPRPKRRAGCSRAIDRGGRRVPRTSRGGGGSSAIRSRRTTTRDDREASADPAASPHVPAGCRGDARLHRGSRPGRTSRERRGRRRVHVDDVTYPDSCVIVVLRQSPGRARDGPAHPLSLVEERTGGEMPMHNASGCNRALTRRTGRGLGRQVGRNRELEVGAALPFSRPMCCSGASR